MHKKFFLLLLFLLIRNAAADRLLDMYESESNGSYLDENDRNTLRALTELESRNVKGGAYNPGSVQFTYGTGQPTVVCAILQITDISLEAQERVLSVQLGDTARWSIDTAISGQGASRVEHLIIKPLDSGLKTSLMIATNRRTYHIRLKSSVNDYMPAVHFYYPNQGLFSNPEGSSVRFANHDNSFSSDDLPPDDDSQDMVQKISLHKDGNHSYVKNQRRRRYDYSIEGHESILPVNAYDDGVITFIQMGDDINNRELPSLVSIVQDSSLIFKSERQNLVNFTIHDNTYIVDGLYEHLRLISNQGNSGVFADIIRNK